MSPLFEILAAFWTRNPRMDRLIPSWSKMQSLVAIPAHGATPFMRVSQTLSKRKTENNNKKHFVSSDWLSLCPCYIIHWNTVSENSQHFSEKKFLSSNRKGLERKARVQSLSLFCYILCFDIFSFLYFRNFCFYLIPLYAETDVPKKIEIQHETVRLSKFEKLLLGINRIYPVLKFASNIVQRVKREILGFSWDIFVQAYGFSCSDERSSAYFLMSIISVYKLDSPISDICLDEAPGLDDSSRFNSCIVSASALSSYSGLTIIASCSGTFRRTLDSVTFIMSCSCGRALVTSFWTLVTREWAMLPVLFSSCRWGVLGARCLCAGLLIFVLSGSLNFESGSRSRRFRFP